jgi:hypothetical protein
MKATDIGAQIDRFHQAREPLLNLMRIDLGYKAKPRIVVRHSFVRSFLRDYGKRD